MSRRLAISALLNTDDPSPGLSMVDVRDKIDTLVASAGPSGPVHIPREIAEMLSQVVAHLTPHRRVPDAIPVQCPPAPIFSISGFPSYPTPSIQHNIVINKKTVITTLFTYEDVHTHRISRVALNTSDPSGICSGATQKIGSRPYTTSLIRWGALQVAQRKAFM